MTGATLPAGLAPWADYLARLEPEFAVALGPLLRRLDLLLRPAAAASDADGEVDGWAGIGRRGDPSRLLMSEWALADAVPLEFLRRAVGAELLYLAPLTEAPQPRGGLAVLVDTGPEQLGACRVAQLAVLIVLSRRADAAGAELVLGVAGDEPGRWRGGDAATLLAGWLGARRSSDPDAAEVRRWLDELPEGAEPWLVGGATLARAAPPGARTVRVREAAWDADGAIAVEVALDGARAELALPRTELSVRALRGVGVQNRPRPESGGPLRVRHALFPSLPPRLLLRGADERLLHAVTVRAAAGAARPRAHRFDGRVLGAGCIGSRLTALVERDGRLLVRVVGKRLAGVTGIDVAADQLGLDEADLAAAAAELRPVHFAAGAILWPHGGRWAELRPYEPGVWRDYAAVAPGPAPDQVRVARRPTVFGADGTAVPVGNHTWAITDGPAVRLEPDEDPVGLVQLDDGPTLLTRSAAGLVLRLRGRGRSRTLTRWSGVDGADGAVSTHPRLPWLVLTGADGRVRVVDLASDTVLLDVPAVP